MFLVEGQAKAVLYTGDVRAEHHWVKSLSAAPTMIAYAHRLRQLDHIYLDTTFAIDIDQYRTFPPKSEGVAELLSKLTSYPADTLFHFQAYTFGYESVLQTLAHVLGSQVHLDD